MAKRIGITPDWVEDLLGIWAAADAVGAGPRGHADACPMFQLWGVVDSARKDDDDLYSSAEVLAMRAALEKLQQQQPEAYNAILATFKPWTGIEANADTVAAAKAAGQVLAQYVDDALGG